MTMRDYVRVVRERIIVIVVCTVLVVGAAVAASSTRGVTYTAQVRLLATGATNLTVPIALLVVPTGDNSGVPVVRNDEVAELAAEKLGSDYDAKSVLGRVAASTNQKDMITITTTGDDADEATLIAETYAEAFVDWSAEIRRGQIDEAIANYEQELGASAECITEDSSASDADKLIAAQGIWVATDRRSQLQIARAAEQGAAQLFGSAAVIGTQGPDTMRYGLLGAVVGLIFGLFVAFAIDNLDETVRSRRTVLAVVGAEPVALVPVAEGAPREFVRSSGGDPGSEAYRTLAALLSAQQYHDGRRVVLVTSATDHEGADTVALNLAMALSGANRSTLHVRADSGASAEAGLARVLTGEATIDDVLGQGQTKGLISLDLADDAKGTGSLLGSLGLGETLDALADRFDWVVISTRPVLSSADALYLAPHADRIVIAVKVGGPKTDQIRNAIASLGHVTDAPIEIAMTSDRAPRGGNVRS